MKYNKLLMFALMAVLLSASVAAIGVTPGRTTILFEPNAKQTLGFDILNDQHKDVRVKLTIDGDAEGVEVNLVQDIIKFKDDEERKHVDYELKLPKSFETPGTKEIRIAITEMPDEKSDKPITVNAMVGVITQVRIRVPTEGKYLTVESLEISEGGEGEYATFLLPVTNIGTEKISKASAKVSIFDLENKLIATVSTQEESLDAARRTLLKAVWQANVKPGKYFAVANVAYDGKSAKAEKNFNVGKIKLDIVEMYAKNFRLGGIAKMDVKVKSNWNEILKVFGELFIKTTSMDPIASVKTSTEDVKPNSEQVLSAYWDTTGIKEGKYYITLRINYADGQYIEKQFETLLSLNSMEFSAMGATGQVVAGSSSNKGLTIIIIIILVISNVVWFIRAKRRKKDSL